MDAERTIQTLRDVVLRRRRGLQLPDDANIDELLEMAADELESMQDEIDSHDDIHCEGCCCFDDDDATR